VLTLSTCPINALSLVRARQEFTLAALGLARLLSTLRQTHHGQLSIRLDVVLSCY
jgi:hypothetical protein